VKYYTQTFDNNGNPGPLILVDRFFLSGPSIEPVEFVEIHDAGTALNPAMNVSWVASPYGVDHFELLIGFGSGNPPAAFTGSVLSSNLTAASGNLVTYENEDGSSITVHAGTYKTPRVGAAFGEENSNLFTVQLPVQVGRKYHISVTPVGRCGKGGNSMWSQYQWSVPADPVQVTVPWPDRPLPDTHSQLASDIRPLFLPHYDYSGTVRRDTAAVIIGQVNDTTERHTISEGYKLPTNDPVESYLFYLQEGATALMPFMLYRRQIACNRFPEVSGQVVQVSPLIERIATDVSAGQTRVIDPFIVIGPRPPATAGSRHDICVRDNMPVIAGATYQYMMVLFDDRGEIRETILLAPLTIPLKVK
jgi:hypothetical protein